MTDEQIIDILADCMVGAGSTTAVLAALRNDGYDIGPADAIRGADMTYTPATVLAAEGARIAIITCRGCGSAVMIDPREDIDAQAAHDAWHATFEKPT